MQPFLHELVTCVRAPLAVLGSADGQIAHRGADGVHWRDRRSLCELVLAVGGRPPEPVGWHLVGASSAHFVGAAMGLVTDTADPSVLVERTRKAQPDGLTESITVRNLSRRPLDTEVTVDAACDFATMASIKDGAPAPPLALPTAPGRGAVRWSDDGQIVELSARPSGDDVVIDISPGGRATVRWPLSLPSRSDATLTLALTVRSEVGAAWFDAVARPPWGDVDVRSASPALDALVARSCSDVAALLLSDDGDLVSAAGTPWFLTLFGRDSLWTARMMLPLGTELAEGTLRALARRQASTVDEARSAEPGKILHELRPDETRFDAHRDAQSDALTIPSSYYGTVDATPLWISLLHDAWRWGLPGERVTTLLDPLERALAWVSRRLDADGFLAYRDATGRGLANQGWKDSGDAIQDAAGALASPPVTLCEVQGYAFRALLDAADLLDAFGRPGAGDARDRARTLSSRFRERFWVEGDGARFPAIALDGEGRPADSLSSNIAHLPGTGLLDKDEEALIAELVESRLSSGYGLRTLSARHPQFNPLGYHSGSVWPHDTAIAIVSLRRAGFPGAAAKLVRGLVDASVHFGFRLPELFSGRSCEDGPPLAYPAACRPQAWSAAAGVAVVGAILGITADAPDSRFEVLPDRAFADYFPMTVRGVRLGSDVVEVSVDARGRAEVEPSRAVQSPR
jgi:glycogen debranching enzyme